MNHTRYQGLIFDLDGTLWDTTRSVAQAWAQAAKRLGPDVPLLDEAQIGELMGMTIDEIAEKLFAHLPPAKRIEWTKNLLNNEIKVLRNQPGGLYDGVAEGLVTLQKEYPLYLVSNCGSDYLRLFLEFPVVGGLFRDSECFGNTGQPKGANIRAVMDRNGLLSAAYVGDTAGDQRAAAFAGADFYHAQYGFGEPEKECFGFARFSELVQFFLDLKKA